MNARAETEKPLHDESSLAGVTSFWNARTEAQDRADACLLGTVTDAEAIVRLRDALEKSHVARAVTLRATDRVLDLGGGAGRFALWLAPHVAHVDLVDASHALLDAAKDKAQNLGLTNVTCIESSALSYRAPRGSYDLVLVMGLLTHLSEGDLQQLPSRLAGMMKPSSRLIIKEPITTDGTYRNDTAQGHGEGLAYTAYFRPRRYYVDLFSQHFQTTYQSATCAHPLPFFASDVNDTAQQLDTRAGAILDIVRPAYVRIDPWLHRIESAIRSNRLLRRLLAPVPVVQDLYAMQRRKAAVTQSPGAQPQLSVIVIAFNEADCLTSVTDELSAYLEGFGVAFEVILVDDGSTDATLETMNAICKRDERVRVVALAANRGIGGALREGFNAARGEFITWIPADGQIAPSVIGTLYDKRQSGDVITTVYDERDDAWYRHALSKTLNEVIRWKTGQIAKSGGNYLFARRTWQRHGPQGDDTMMLSTAFRDNVRGAQGRIVEVPIRARARVAGRSKVLNVRTLARTLGATLSLRRRSERSDTNGAQ